MSDSRIPLYRRPTLRSARPRGATLVEFALVLAPLLMILFGIINFGIVFYNQAVITDAAREGARWAAIHTTAVSGSCETTTPSGGTPCGVANAHAAGRLITFGGDGAPSTSYDGAPYATGSLQRVTVTFSYVGIGWYFGGDAVVESATARMYHE